MFIKKVGRGMIIMGALGIALALLTAILLRERGAARSIQILGVEVAAIILLLGVLLRNIEIDDSQLRQLFSSLAERVLDFPILVWVVAGFLFVYFWLFLKPVFLNPELAMNYLAGYVPNINPIGNDLIVMVDRIREWVTLGKSPYALQFYPPLTYIVFTPLLLFKDYAALYKFFTLFTFLSYCALTLLLPLKLIDRKNYPLVLLLFATGLFSYGFQFEVERGQYNVFTFLLCLSSIYIFHYQPKYRLLAYLLFSLSIQLKLYPVIFVVMFVEDWRNWKTAILRFAALGMFNLMLFFAMGYQTFLDFFRSVTAQITNPTWHGLWNHSTSAFVSSVKADGLGLVSRETLRLIRHNAESIEAALLVVFAILFLASLVLSHLRRESGVDPYLLLACTIGALTLPISYDYTLSILAAPVLLFLCGIAEMKKRWYKLISALAVIGLSIAYFSTLFPYTFRPTFLKNIFPALLLILLLETILNFMRYRNNRMQPTESG